MNKTKHVENKLNEILVKVKAISTNELAKVLIDKYNIFNRVKYFYSGILHNYFVVIPTKKYIKYFSGTTRIYWWNVKRKY